MQILEDYAAAVLAKDVDAIMELYDANVRVFDAWGMWSYEGAGAWRTTVEQWFSSLGSERVKVTFEDVQTALGQELAHVSAIVTYAGISAEGAPLREMQNRLTWVLKSESGAWKIIHEHTSAPIDFDHAKAILQRPR